MERSDDLEARLEMWIQRPIYHVFRAPAKVLVVEPESSGEAKIECQIPDGCMCIEWRISKTVFFGFLQEDKHADGALLLCRSDGSFEAHIIECKKTVTQTKWSETLRQLRWTLSKLLAIAGVLGIEIRTAVFGTAYRSDKLSEEESPNPAAGKPLLDSGQTPGSEEIEITKARLQQLAWMDDEVTLPGFARPFRHVKIQLDKTTGHAAHGL